MFESECYVWTNSVTLVVSASWESEGRVNYWGCSGGCYWWCGHNLVYHISSNNKAHSHLWHHNDQLHSPRSLVWHHHKNYLKNDGCCCCGHYHKKYDDTTTCDKAETLKQKQQNEARQRTGPVRKEIDENGHLLGRALLAAIWFLNPPRLGSTSDRNEATIKSSQWRFCCSIMGIKGKCCNDWSHTLKSAVIVRQWLSILLSHENILIKFKHS